MGSTSCLHIRSSSLFRFQYGDLVQVLCIVPYPNCTLEGRPQVKSLGVVFFRSGGDGEQGGVAAGAVVGVEHVGQV